MADKKKNAAVDSVGNVPATPEQRIALLLDRKFHGNRSAMGKALGFSHAAISRVVAGKKGAGPRLLHAVASRLGVDKNWLLTGEGSPGIEMGVKTELTAGHPVVRDISQLALAKRELPADAWLNLSAKLTSTQVWLLVSGKDLLVSSKHYGFKGGDMLLLETDAELIAKKQPFGNTLCVVANAGKKNPAYRLGFADSAGEDAPGRAYIDFVDEAIPAAEQVEEFILQRWPDGKLTARKRTLRIGADKQTQSKWPAGYDIGSGETPVKLSDVIAIWTGIMYRRGMH